MTSQRPLLMIPGPVEVSPAVLEALADPPPSHLAPDLIAAFGEALRAMRAIWRAPASARSFAVPGGGTLAMEAAACNLVAPGERALVAVTGYFGDRMAEMLRRRGAEVETIAADPGEVPDLDRLETELERAVLERRAYKALFATHVDTSTGVRVDPEPLARLARQFDALSVFDGVCATAAERFEMEAWDADLYFTASQKAVGLPPGLALWVAGPRALEARHALAAPPPMTLDFDAWSPVMEAYEEGRGAYFSTPPTGLVMALRASLAEILADGPDAASAVTATVDRHRRAAEALRAAWSALRLRFVPSHAEQAANTLSALHFPEGRGNEVLAAIREQGVVVAGGLLPALAGRYFRIGHMGHVTRSAEPLLRTVRAVALALYDDKMADGAQAAFEERWDASPRELRPAQA